VPGLYATMVKRTWYFNPRHTAQALCDVCPFFACRQRILIGHWPTSAILMAAVETAALLGQYPTYWQRRGLTVSATRAALTWLGGHNMGQTVYTDDRVAFGSSFITLRGNPPLVIKHNMHSTTLTIIYTTYCWCICEATTAIALDTRDHILHRRAYY